MSAHRILGAVDLITFQFRSRWEKIQISFADEPRQSDHQSVLSRCSLANVRSWKPSWDKKDNVATEDLRLSLRLYRSFFGRLLFGLGPVHSGASFPPFSPDGGLGGGFYRS